MAADKAIILLLVAGGAGAAYLLLQNASASTENGGGGIGGSGGGSDPVLVTVPTGAPASPIILQAPALPALDTSSAMTKKEANIAPVVGGGVTSKNREIRNILDSGVPVFKQTTDRFGSEGYYVNLDDVNAGKVSLPKPNTNKKEMKS